MKTIKYFTASWCAPCKMFKPIMQQVASEGYHVEFIDIDQSPGEATHFGIRSVPTCVIEEAGMEVSRFSGAMSKDAVLSYLK